MVASLAEQRGDMIRATVIPLMFIAVAAVVIRLLGRRLSTLKFGTDDLCIILALILSLGLDADELVAVKFGFGQHMHHLAWPTYHAGIKAHFAANILSNASITSTKLSLLFFYGRVITFRNFRILAAIVGLAQCAVCVASTFTILFTCRSIHDYWDNPLHLVGCSYIQASCYAITGLNVVLDLVILCLPIPWLAQLQMDRGRKIGVIGLFILGSFVCVAAVIRLPLLRQINYADFSWSVTDVAIWYVVECNIGILCACLPVMWPFFKKHLPDRLFGLSRSRLSNSRSAWSRSGKIYPNGGSHPGQGRAIRYPESKSFVSNDPSSLHANSRSYSTLGHHVYRICGHSAGWENGPHSSAQDETKPQESRTAAATIRRKESSSLPTLPNNVKVKKGWPALKTSPVKERFRVESPRASIRHDNGIQDIHFESIPAWLAEEERRHEAGVSPKSFDQTPERHETVLDADQVEYALIKREPDLSHRRSGGSDEAWHDPWKCLKDYQV